MGWRQTGQLYHYHRWLPQYVSFSTVYFVADWQPVLADHPESTIVRYARLLQNSRAPLTQVSEISFQLRGACQQCNQVGIQFVQIGDDARASQYLRELDNTLRDKYSIPVRLWRWRHEWPRPDHITGYRGHNAIHSRIWSTKSKNHNKDSSRRYQSSF